MYFKQKAYEGLSAERCTTGVKAQPGPACKAHREPVLTEDCLQALAAAFAVTCILSAVDFVTNETVVVSHWTFGLL